MINNIQFKITAGKINKIHEFYTIFAQKMHYIIRQRDRGQAEANCLRPRPKFWPREDLTSLHTVNLSSTGTITSSPLSTGWESRYIRYSAYYWTSRLPCHRRSQMERPTGRSHLSAISAHFQKTTKTASRKDKSFGKCTALLMSSPPPVFAAPLFSVFQHILSVFCSHGHCHTMESYIYYVCRTQRTDPSILLSPRRRVYQLRPSVTSMPAHMLRTNSSVSACLERNRLHLPRVIRTH